MLIIAYHKPARTSINIIIILGLNTKWKTVLFTHLVIKLWVTKFNCCKRLLFTNILCRHTAIRFFVQLHASTFFREIKLNELDIHEQNSYSKAVKLTVSCILFVTQSLPCLRQEKQHFPFPNVLLLLFFYYWLDVGCSSDRLHWMR